MKRDIANKWVRRLRSGKRKQATSALCEYDGEGNRTGYCCLGVLEEIRNPKSKALAPLRSGATESEGLFPLVTTSRWSGLTDAEASALADMNDGGATFAEIADWIQENLWGQHASQEALQC